MVNDLLGAIWRRVPKALRRWTVRFSHPRFGVSAGAIITDSSGRVLLLKHRFRPGSGWGLPGGFLKADEQPLEGLQRELREEIALELDQFEIFWARSFKQPRQIEIVFCATTRDDPSLQSI